MKQSIRVTINGRRYEDEVEPRILLAHFLRETIGLTGTHVGCVIGECGACSILMDGKVVKSCLHFAVQADGREITTIEGISSDNSHPVQQAWIQEQVPQCGYCQSGQIMAAAALLKKNASPTDKDIDTAMQGHICRCGTYPRIRKAIKTASVLMTQKACITRVMNI
jgi:aerobic-type carbon monoxide dehydrogenase small subunit (CoxS/CutS family)